MQEGQGLRPRLVPSAFLWLSLFFGSLHPFLLLLTLYSFPLQLLAIITWEPNPFPSRAHNHPFIWESGPVPSDAAPWPCPQDLLLPAACSPGLRMHPVPWPSPSPCAVFAWTVCRALDLPDLGGPESRAKVGPGFCLWWDCGLCWCWFNFYHSLILRLSLLLSAFPQKALFAYVFLL